MDSHDSHDSQGHNILICGTGDFAARIAFDIAATATTPTVVVVAGRNQERAAWIRTAASARAAIFGTPTAVEVQLLDFEDADAVEQTLDEVQPRVVMQCASRGRLSPGPQSRWGEMVGTAGLSLTSIFQARLSALVSKAIQTHAPDTYFVNGCYPDVANSLIASLGLRVDCGIGNVAILANAFLGLLGEPRQTIQVLAQHRNVGLYRVPPSQRSADSVHPRVWINGDELDDVAQRFSSVQLTPEPVMDISGASGVPLLQAMVKQRPWRGHVPGPGGLPGGYPVSFDGKLLSLDLPVGIDESEAISWNAAFELESGVVVDGEHVRYTGKVRDVLRQVSPDLASGFVVSDFEAAHDEMSALRARMEALPAN